MADTLVAALEEAFQEARGRDIALAEQLVFIARRVHELSPQFSSEVDNFVRRLQTANAGKHAPQIGETMPGFILPDDEGRLVSLDRLLERAPVAIAFLRGHWCPYCRLHAAGLAKVAERIAPVQLVAISAETQAYTQTLKMEAGASFPFLSDIGNGYALSLNLAVWVDDTMSSLIAGAGWNVPDYQGQAGWILPIPSVFIVGQDGLITARHVDADYRRRLDLDALSDAAQSVLVISTADRGAD
jgi:peroxiredoxin